MGLIQGLQGVDLSRKDLSGRNFKNTDLSGANLEKAVRTPTSNK